MDPLNSLTINKQMLFVFSLIAFACNIPKQVKHECNYAYIFCWKTNSETDT